MNVPESTTANTERRIAATINDTCGPDDTLYNWLEFHLLLDQPLRSSRRSTIDVCHELVGETASR